MSGYLVNSKLSTEAIYIYEPYKRYVVKMKTQYISNRPKHRKLRGMEMRKTEMTNVSTKETKNK